MKRILSSLLFLAASVAAHAQFTTLAGNTMYFEQIDPTGTYIVETFPPLPATGQALWMADADFGGTVGAQLGNQFVYSFNYSTDTASINVAQADFNAAPSTAGAILNKPTIPSTESATVTTDSSGNVTWTYPTAYPAGTVPRCSCLPHGTTTTNINAQWISATNTSVTFKVWTLPQTSVLGIVVLGAPAGASTLVCDVIATN